MTTLSSDVQDLSAPAPVQTQEMEDGFEINVPRTISLEAMHMATLSSDVQALMHIQEASVPAPVQTQEMKQMEPMQSMDEHDGFMKVPRTISLEAMHTKPRAKKQHTEETVSPAFSSSSPFQSKNYTNLISEQSSCILFATDEWFAAAENLIKDANPVFIPDLFCPQGKVMDGWETRRRRTEGHDWCVIAIKGRNSTGAADVNNMNDVVGIEIDTAYFTGNQAPRISIEVANCYSQDQEEEEWMYTWMPGALKRSLNGGGVQGTGQSPSQVKNAQKACEKFQWTEILPMTPLKPGYEETRMHYFMLDEETRERARGFTHVRVNYFPDGGVARLRLWGFSQQDPTSSMGQLTDDVDVVPSAMPYHHPELSLETNGGIGLTCSNKHYGVPGNLIRADPRYGKDMGDGWETARHPDRPPILIKDPVTNLIDNPLMDWGILKLGMGGAVENSGISRIIIDTKHFKGNFPESVMVEGCNANATQASDFDVCSATPEEKSGKVEWFPLLERSKMGPDREHIYDSDQGQLVNADRAVTHVRVSIYPDGGISRVRVYGQPALDTLDLVHSVDAALII